ANALITPVAGNLHAWTVEDGATVAAGQVVAVMEAMKMETQVLAPRAGRLAITQAAGDYLAAGTVLGRIEDV
ncbi:hypothetical protein SB11R_22740, partial [Pseudomonas oryzihabitans]